MIRALALTFGAIFALIAILAFIDNRVSTREPTSHTFYGSRNAEQPAKLRPLTLADAPWLCAKCGVASGGGDYPAWHPPVPVVHPTAPDFADVGPMTQLPAWQWINVGGANMDDHEHERSHSGGHGGHSHGGHVDHPHETPAVAQFSASGVPEPATWLTLCLGFWLVGAGMRGRLRENQGEMQCR